MQKLYSSLADQEMFLLKCDYQTKWMNSENVSPYKRQKHTHLYYNNHTALGILSYG